MIDKSIINYEMSDLAIQQVIGDFIRETRLRQNKTQEVVSVKAGIKRMTLVRMEQGKGGTLSTLIRILRSLQQFHVLFEFEATRQISPLQLAKLEQKKRLRASPLKTTPRAKRNNEQ